MLGPNLMTAWREAPAHRIDGPGSFALSGEARPGTARAECGAGRSTEVAGYPLEPSSFHVPVAYDYGAERQGICESVAGHGHRVISVSSVQEFFSAKSR